MSAGQKKISFAKRAKGFDNRTSVKSKPKKHEHGNNPPECVQTKFARKTGGVDGGRERPDWYQKLPEEQINVFKSLFDLLDSDGRGSINAKELFECMGGLDLGITISEIEEIVHGLDGDGNGEITFDEFLYCMCQSGIVENENEEQRVGGYNRKHTFFAAITKFALKHSLGDIERYYASKARQVPHVLTHYTAGARLLGLNDKQIEQRFRSMQKKARNSDSPYAKPLRFVTSLSNKVKVSKTTPKRHRTKFEVTRQACEIGSTTTEHQSSRRKAIDKTVLKFLQEMDNSAKLFENLPSVQLLSEVRSALASEAKKVGFASNKGKRQFASKSAPPYGRTKISPTNNEHSRISGWKIPLLTNNDVPLPVIHISSSVPTIEDLPNIRGMVSTAIDKYYTSLRKRYVKTAWDHWDELHIDEFSSQKMLDNFRKTYCAYSPHTEEDVFVICPWIPGPKRQGSADHTRTRSAKSNHSTSPING